MSRTLADMTPDERHQMIGRWAEVEGHRHLGVINSAPDEDEDQYPHPPYDVQIIFPLHAWASAENTTNDQVTPRLDLPPAWTPEGKPIPGEWEEGYIHVDYDEPDMSDGRPHGPTEPVSIEGQATGEMCYFDGLPDGLSVTMSADGTGEGKARRFVTEWEEA